MKCESGTECNTWTPSATVKKNNNNSSCKNSINNNINISSSEKPGHWARSRATVGGKGHTECHSGLCQSSLFLRKNTTCRQRCTQRHTQQIHYITQRYIELFFSSSSMSSNDLVSIDIVFFQLYRFLFGHIQKRLGIS